MENTAERIKTRNQGKEKALKKKEREMCVLSNRT